MAKKREKELNTAEARMNIEYKDRSWLKEQYYENGLSTAAMGKLCGVSPATIHHWMRIKYKMRLRTFTRAQELRLKRNREARAEKLLEAVFQSGDSLGDVVLAELEDWSLFEGSPESLKRVQERDKREAQSLSDAEYRRAERERLERDRDIVSHDDYALEDQLSEWQAIHDRPSKRQ